VRAKPIALTGLAAMLGALFILDDPIFNGLAISLIFGIFVSTLLTLVVIPVLYYACAPLRRAGPAELHQHRCRRGEAAGAGVGRRPRRRRRGQPGGSPAGPAAPGGRTRRPAPAAANVRLLAPADGVVTSRDAEPGSTVVAGQAVLRVIEPSSLWVKVRLDQGARPGWRWGCRPDRAAFEPGPPLAGKVARVEALSDSVTEERVAQIGFDQVPAGLSVGELAEVTLSLPPTAKAVLLPNAAIKRRQAQTGVWVIDAAHLALRARAHRPGEPGRPGPGARRRQARHDDRRRAQREGHRRAQPHHRGRCAGGAAAVISLAGRDILHSWSKFVLTGIGLGLLIGVTLTMAGVYRGMVDDARHCSTTAAPTCGWCSRTRRGPTRNRRACATTRCAACSGCPAWRAPPTSPT
jgi:hypothetical protein